MDADTAAVQNTERMMTHGAIIETVESLTGECMPIGRVEEDRQRYVNLKAKIAVADALIRDIEEVMELCRRPEPSIAKTAALAFEWIEKTRDTMTADIFRMKVTERSEECER